MTEVASSNPGLQVLSVRHYEAPAPANLTQELVDPETYATTKEEEWVTKKKVELTTKRQIETRVKRQVVLEDGKVVEDTGPIVTTNTTEDTEKQESSQTEHREVGDDPPDKDWVAIPSKGGLVKEVKERKVRSREEKEERLETEDVQHLGDISDDAYLNAIQHNQAEGGDLRVALERSRGLELQNTGPAKGRIVHQSSKTKKVVDTEDSQHLSEVQQDGRILTETRKTTEHEEVNDAEEPDDGSSGEEEDIHKEASHRYSKTKDQELVEYLADGKKIGEEMRYEAENVEGDRRGDPSNLAMEHQEWESLSTRIRKMRRNKLQQLHKGAEGGVPIDRKDALTKKPLDFDQEEETRKVETSKWLENHFGSESRSSKDSIDDDDLPATGTSTSFINVTMKSTKNKTNRMTSPPERSTPRTYPTPPINSSSRVFVSSPEPEATPPSTSYFQGISEWKNERDHHKERQARTSFSPSSGFKDRVQVLPTGPNHTFTTSTSPSPPFSNLASSSLASKNYRGSQSSNLNGRNSSGPESPSPFQSTHNTEKYSYSKYYSERDSPSHDRMSPMYPGHRLTGTDRSSPYERSSSPYHAKILHNGKTTSSEEDQRSSSPRHRRRFNGNIEREDNRYLNEQQRSSSRFIQKESYPRLEEPAPDYSPPSEHRGTPSPPQIRSTPPPDASKKKVYQRTRFAADIPPVKPKPQSPPHHKGGIGESFRKLVGKFRSASSERKKEKRKRGKKGSSRSPSPHGHTYQQYNVIDNNLPSAGGKSGGGESTEAGESNDEQPVAPPRSSRHSGTQTLDRRERSTQTKQDMERRRTGSPVVQKYYLGEDPFGGSIYGREKEYDGVTPFRRKVRRGSDGAEEERNARNHQLSHNGSSTLGRLSKSTGRLINDRIGLHSQHTINHVIDYSDRGGVQTLPRKLHDEEKLKKQVYTTRSNAERVTSPQQHWEGRYNSSNNTNNNSSSMINVSIVNKATSPPSSIGMNSPTGPAKPARTYRSSLLRSKSFNVHAGDAGRDLNSVYKSNPHLHRLDESPPPLKSPGIVTSISRSTKDISEAVNEEDDIRRPFGNYNQNSFTKSSNHVNGYSNSRISTHDTKKKIFMKGLMDRAPELYKTLHGDEVEEKHKISSDIDDRPGKMFTSTPLKNGHKVVEYSNSFRSSNTSSPLANGHDRVHSPITGNSYTTSIMRTPTYHNGGEITNRSVTRRGSNDDYTETVRITSKSDDPVRPSVTNTVQSFSKKIIPTKNGGHSRETIESSETKTITTSRYRGGDQYPTRNGGVIIEVRNNK